MRKFIIAMILTFGASAQAEMYDGQYEKVLGDGSVDQLTIKNYGSVVEITETRQVGRSEKALDTDVPYPTICRVAKFGNITSQDNLSITYQVIGVNLVSRVKVDKGQLENDVNCNTYINILNGEARKGAISFSIEKEGFNKK